MTRLMFLTSFTMRLAAVVMVSVGRIVTSAVMKSVVVTARRSDGVVVGALVAHDADLLRMLVSAAKYWLGRWAMGSLSISSRQMASASCTMATFSGSHRR